MNSQNAAGRLDNDNPALTVSHVRPARERKPKARKTVTASRPSPMAKRSPRLAIAITVALGIGIPALTLALSTAAGRLAMTHHYALAAVTTAVGLTVLAVSLSHLAHAIRDITHSADTASWLLAIAVDASIVVAESIRVAAPDADLDRLTLGVLIAVTICSMCLNIWAFLRHR